MNSTKRTIKGNGNNRTSQTQQKHFNPKVLLITGIVLVVLLVGAVLMDQLYKRTILTIDQQKYTMDDLGYYFYAVEAQYDYYDQVFGGTGGYWDMVFDQNTGTTLRDRAKTEAMDLALYTEIIHREAIANGYQLTPEEEETIADQVDTLLTEQISPAIARNNGFTTKFLTNAMEKTTLVDRYREDTIEALAIDQDAIREEYDFEDYKQFDFEYFMVSTTKENDAAELIPLTEEEKSAAYDKLVALSERAQDDSDWENLIAEGENEIIYSEDSFTVDDSKFEDDFRTVVSSLENNEISDIIEASNGFYLVRMQNNSSTEHFDSVVEEAISSEENTKFNNVYNEILSNYEHEFNLNALKRYRMGEITLVE